MAHQGERATLQVPGPPEAAPVLRRDAEALLRLVVESTPGAIAIFDRHMRYLAVSRRWQEAYRLRGEDVLGRSHYEVFPELPERWKEVHRRCLAGAVESCDEDPFVRADGRLDWVKWEIRPWYDAAGEIGGLVLLSEVVTGRKLAEEALRRKHRALLMLTRCTEAMLRAETEEALYAEVCRVIVETGGYPMCWVGAPQEDERRSVVPVASAGDAGDYLATVDVVWADVERGRGPTGTALRTLRPVVGVDFVADPALAPWRESALRHGLRCSSALPLVWEGERLGVLTMYSGEARAFDEAEIQFLSQLADDLAYGVHALQERARRVEAERQRAEALEQLAAEKERLRQSQKLESVGRLAGGVAHDFNNLLTVILSCSEALRRDLSHGQPPDPEDVAEIHAAGERARDLTRQLLTFARKQVIAPAPLDLNAVVRGSERLLRRVLGEQVELHVALEPAPWTVLCDAAQMEQVILNLAVNARDAMPDGGQLSLATANVTVAPGGGAGEPALAPGEWVRLSVRDAGHGMTAEVKAHLFEPFFTTKRQGQGTGLGLATVYGIVEQSGGAIRVESEPGLGTTFELWFPRARAAAAAAAPAAAPAASPGAAGVRGSETILVVEDDAQVREVTARALRAGGYRVLVEGSAGAALEAAARAQGRIDLVVTDVVMPDVDGRALAEALRAHHGVRRVLFVSGYTRELIDHGCVLDRGIEFLPKPFTAATLLGRVRSLLDA
ncbi:ATP-binding protein [Anaeromyxobacter diazotrophicus]|uniref:histidine kinase n=1 Tax=Anaeromyxobacter diazotrophicus TaxID=2590199 RepID=A0A7I9VRS5_9BACT|nr:ATP-binding protein [Anaeromyxobacter diazotrophicus]GEJ58790.1 hypothetical protein AMYX_35310 [Anaeromyxobacter diazotrophicus]